MRNNGRFVAVCLVLAIAFVGSGGVSAFAAAPQETATAGPVEAGVMAGASDLVWGTYLGGSDEDSGYAVVVDGDGAIYVAGRTTSSDLPATVGSYDTSYSDKGDVFVAKLSADGTSLEYLTYLGGSEADQPRDIAVDDSGVAYVCGVTESSDFPTTASGFDDSYNGSGDGFVVAVAADGASLVYATFLGGTSTEDAEAIAVDSAGTAYVTGDTESSDFPTTVGAYSTVHADEKDVFVAKLAAGGGALVYATYVGGTGTDTAMAICVDDLGAAYVAGVTASSGYPTTALAYDTTLDNIDAFVTKVMTDGTGLSYSTFLGGAAADGASGIAVDSAGAAFVVGTTASLDFPTTAGAYSVTPSGADTFVAKLNVSGAELLAKSTCLGGSSDDTPQVLADIDGRVYLAGTTSSSDLPIAAGPGMDTSLDSSKAGYVVVLGNLFDEIEYATYLEGESLGSSQAQGLARDANGDLYVVGVTSSADFAPIASGYDSSIDGSGDAFVVKFTPNGEDEVVKVYCPLIARQY